jgi:hypothetical protein
MYWQTSSLCIENNTKRANYKIANIQTISKHYLNAEILINLHFALIIEISEAAARDRLMTAALNRGAQVEVKQWWIAVKAHQELFLQLIALESLATTKFRDIDAVICQIEADYRRLQDMTYPDIADGLRGHLLHAIEHVMNSLWSLKNRQLFESDVRFNIAQVDMTMVKHELLNYRIVD